MPLVFVPFVMAGGATATAIIETPVTALSKLGGPGATDAVIGSTDVPAALMTTAAQFLSGRIIAARNWDTTKDVTVRIGLALDGPQVDGDTFDLDFNYIYARSGTAALADLNKAVTSLAPGLTVTTAEGLADETLYALVFTLDRNDATNPYAGESIGGFGFQLNIDAASSITSIYVIAVGIEYPVTF